MSTERNPCLYSHRSKWASTCYIHVEEKTKREVGKKVGGFSWRGEPNHDPGFMSLFFLRVNLSNKAVSEPTNR
jgi:hypothetical protein